MLKFVIDEDMPRSTAIVLRSKGYDVLDARDCGIRGKSPACAGTQTGMKKYSNLHKKRKLSF